MLDDEEVVVGAAVDGIACVAMALIDELNRAVGGVGAIAAEAFNEDAPLNGAKRSRLNAAWLIRVEQKRAATLTLQCEHSSRANPPHRERSALFYLNQETSDSEENDFPSSRTASPKTRGGE